MAQMLLVPREQPAAQAPTVSRNTSHNKHHEERGDTWCFGPRLITRPTQKAEGCKTRMEDITPHRSTSPAWQGLVLLAPNFREPEPPREGCAHLLLAEAGRAKPTPMPDSHSQRRVSKATVLTLGTGTGLSSAQSRSQCPCTIGCRNIMKQPVH